MDLDRILMKGNSLDWRIVYTDMHASLHGSYTYLLAMHLSASICYLVQLMQDSLLWELTETGVTILQVYIFYCILYSINQLIHLLFFLTFIGMPSHDGLATSTFRSMQVLSARSMCLLLVIISGWKRIGWGDFCLPFFSVLFFGLFICLFVYLFVCNV